MDHIEKYKCFLKEFPVSKETLANQYTETRERTSQICSPLETEDFTVQPCPQVSPPKWHLGHTTWFFEEMILTKYKDHYTRYNESFQKLFNSYYKSAGEHWIQGKRGNLSRPTVANIFDYRKNIDKKILNFLDTEPYNADIHFILELGIQHEQQHQELLLMDIKYILGTNPDFPKYNKLTLTKGKASTNTWESFEEGIYEVGHTGKGFGYDNEGPRHKTYIYPYSVRKECISNGEYLEFISDGGYSEPRHWLSEGWSWVNAERVKSPLYWFKKEGEWYEYTLHGLATLDLNHPVTHISYFEADAFAKWSGNRLPTEFEFEAFYKNKDTAILSSKLDHPTSLNQQTNQVWSWTRSQYSPYPGFKTFDGKLGEYNGKFMCNQFVLRGGCVATPKNHYRTSYRNFYQPQQRWMFSGIRIAKDLK